MFLFKDGSVKLGDMNVSKVAKLGLVYTQTGTPYYASPEVWRDQPYDLKSDIWSLGCVIYEAAALQPPFRASDMNALYRKVMRGDYPPLPVIYSQDLTALIRAMLQVSPPLRPTCEHLLDLPVVKKHVSADLNAYESPDLLGTIKLPRNLTSLSERLPAPAYDKKSRYGSLPVSSKRSIFRPTASGLPKSLETSASNQLSPIRERPPDSVKLPRIYAASPARLQPQPYVSSRRLIEIQKEHSLARQIEAVRVKYDRVRPGIFARNQPEGTKSSVLPPWWG